MENWKKAFRDFVIEKGIDCKEDFSLKDFTSFRIGGRVDFYINPFKSQIKEVFSFLKSNAIPYFILGNGTNVLLPDTHIKGVLIGSRHLSGIKIDKDEVLSGSGVVLRELVSFSIKAHLTGIEFLTGIPGTVGGAVFVNAGAFGSSIGEFVEWIRLYDIKQEDIKIVNRNNLVFSYRHSSLRDVFIIDVAFKLERGDREISKMRVKEFGRKRSHLPTEPSAGCIFINPALDSAGRLIDKAMLKGMHVGDAYISEKHANFIVNKGNATYKDVVELIDRIKEEIFKIYNIKLNLEIFLFKESKGGIYEERG